MVFPRVCAFDAADPKAKRHSIYIIGPALTSAAHTQPEVAPTQISAMVAQRTESG